MSLPNGVIVLLGGTCLVGVIYQKVIIRGGMEEGSILIAGSDSFYWSKDLGSEQSERKGRD
jgi:hypothetical protein